MRRALLRFATLFVCLALSGWLIGRPVPDQLWTILLMIAVYFFHRPPEQERGKPNAAAGDSEHGL